MNTIKDKDYKSSENSQGWTFCIITIWITVMYSVIIQYKYIEIPNGMLILGSLVLCTFLFACAHKSFDIELIFSNESLWMIGFMIYMFPVGMLMSPNPSSHMAQWVTSMEYIFMMIVLSSIIKNTGTISFHALILIVAVIMSVIFLQNPVLHTEGRYSISVKVNPNGLGMTFTAGIWAVLFLQQKKNNMILLPLGIVPLLIYSITKTGSRKALIAAGIIIVSWFIFCYIPQIISGNSKWKSIILFFSVIIAIFLGKEFINMYAGSDISSRMGGLDKEVTSGLRSTMYKNGWELFKLNPLFGLGFQGYAFYYGKYSHATLVEVPVSAGILGTILYYIPYFISIKKCISMYNYFKQCEELRGEASEVKMVIIMWAAMLFYCICIIHPYQFDSFIMFGIMLGCSAYLEKKMSLYRMEHEHIQEHRNKWIK